MNTLAASLHRRTAEHERREVARLQQVLDLAAHIGCQVSRLGEHFGDALLLAGCVERELLEQTATRQFSARMTRLFSLAPDTTYSYFDARTDLVDDAAPITTTHPLAILWAGVRAHAAASSMMAATIDRLREVTIRVHPAAARVE